MTTPQLLSPVLFIAIAAASCSRGDDDAAARRTADQVRAVAARAGDQLADSWLTTKIQAQYFADDDIKARHINVSTRDGVVTLTGLVDGDPQRKLAVQIARMTDGVREVHDRLTVTGQPAEQGAVSTAGSAGSGTAASAPPAPAPAPQTPDRPFVRDDALTTARIQSKFFVDDRVKGRRIDVDTQGGVVTLSGEVADEGERAQALLLARNTDGVVRVEDHLTVAPAAERGTAGALPRIDDAMVTTAIQAKYFVDPEVKGSAVDVSVTNGVVVVEGTVASEAGRMQAIAIARNTEGVVQVIDRLRVRAGR